ncbi:MAG: DUF58 domain-containing protein [Nannocystaceae bacterium]
MAEDGALGSLLPVDLRERLRMSDLSAPRGTFGERSGQHRSQRPGLGHEFRDHRPYVPGDDLRRLDWRAAARQDKLILRQTEAEAELTATVVLDASGGMGYGEGEKQKWRHATAVAAAVALVASQRHDRLRFLIGREQEVDLRGVRRCGVHELHLRLAERCAVGTSGRCPWSKLLSHTAETARKRGVVVVISDLLDLADATDDDSDLALERALDQLAMLRSQRQRIVLVQVLHPDELNFPWLETKVFRFEDLTRSQVAVEGVGAQLGDSYLKKIRSYLARVEAGAEARQLRLVRIVTDAPLRDGVLRVFGNTPPAARANTATP